MRPHDWTSLEMGTQKWDRLAGYVRRTRLGVSLGVYSADMQDLLSSLGESLDMVPPSAGSSPSQENTDLARAVRYIHVLFSIAPQYTNLTMHR